MHFFEAVYQVVKQIPPGKVASYGQVALLAGRPRAARVVGYALHRNPAYGEIPCHRVVFQDGSLAQGFVFGGPGEQERMLREEGVQFIDGKVDMKTCRWNNG